MTIEGTEVVFTKVAGPEMPAAEAEAAGDGQVETEQNPAGDTAASGSDRADSASVAK